MRDFDSLSKKSRGKFNYVKFVNLKNLTKNTIGKSNDNFELELTSILNLYRKIDEQIIESNRQISTIIKNLNPLTLSILGIGVISCASIISEFRDISKFSDSSKMLSFAGLEPDIIESGTMSCRGKMVKHGSGYLRYSLMNIALTVIRFNNTFYDYYYKKISECKSHRGLYLIFVKKIIRIIFILETKDIQFDPSLLK